MANDGISATPSDERREYFRIDDEVHLEVEPLTDGLYQQLEKAPPSAGDSPCDLVLHIRSLSSQASSMLSNIRKRDSEIAQYLTLQDRKLELIARAVVGKQLDIGVGITHRVNIGAGGIGFGYHEAFELGRPLRVRVLFFPSHLCVEAVGKVTHCVSQSSDPQHPYRIGVEFTLISQAVQDALMGHVLERQSSLLRQRRESDN